MEVTLFHWLVFSAALFSMGIFGLLTRKNVVGILISIELMLNAGAINFVAFNRWLSPTQVDGQIMSIFVIAIAAAEVLVALAILVMIYRNRRSVEITRLNTLRH